VTVTGDAPAGRRPAKLDPDTLAALEEERDFLLRSLDDLEREHEAGDVDDHDYEVLKDDYTARAARVIRAIETHQARLAAAKRPRSWRRIALTTLGVVAFAVVAGVLVADAAGRRGSGDTLTGDIRTTTRDRLAEALELASEQRYEEAVEVYDEILAEQPDHAEALTYKGWAQYLSGDPEGIGTLTAAVEADPEFPDAHAFLALILARAGRTDAALMELDRLEALDPPPDVAALVSGLRAELEAQQAGTGADGGGAGGAP
jgi:tetratricopeptide (TPR) repeat protein